MWFNEKERVALTVFGLLALVALGVLLWQRHHPPLAVAGAPEPAQTAQWDAALSTARQVDVNTASVAELERLPGVGPALAQRIVEYRTRYGAFQHPTELQRVNGVGPKTLKGIEDYVTTTSP